ncbi:hypothetical protein B5P19_00775 [Clavibacter sepedonicus]|uniref:Uncharacterized protein n=1 Tax=Clavibacter sepedonicus TaxID=31964 RepID=B0RGI0_CLASE|nr:hypothetical protein B5P19_00775 [Clavibacter sepedonicus]OQJ55162.1 hypothetical protein B5P20_14465 [Clavibacter sepedonicus]CAQ01238.1 hypothetical protein CMS1122 [Clavibacter sepedonicus]
MLQVAGLALATGTLLFGLGAVPASAQTIVPQAASGTTTLYLNSTYEKTLSHLVRSVRVFGDGLPQAGACVAVDPPNNYFPNVGEGKITVSATGRYFVQNYIDTSICGWRSVARETKG